MTTTRDEQGTAVLELALLVPLFMMFIFVAVGLGRLGLSRGNIDAAARDAARAGSLARTSDDAVAAATAATNDSLAANNLTCADLAVNVDTGQFRPGGFVRVDVSCRVEMTDLVGMWTPGASTMRARSVAVIDTYRSTR